MKRVAAGLAALAVVVSANAWGGDTKKDKEKLQGTWNVTAMSFGDKKQDIPEGTLTVIFAGDKMTVKSPKGDEEGTYKLDTSKKPMTIDTTMKKGGKEETSRGIYELQGDTLKLGFGKDARPKDFTSKEMFTLYLKRKK